MPLQAPRKRERVREERELAMLHLDQQIDAARRIAQGQTGPLAQAVVMLANCVERVFLAEAARDELERR